MAPAAKPGKEFKVLVLVLDMGGAKRTKSFRAPGYNYLSGRVSHRDQGVTVWYEGASADHYDPPSSTAAGRLAGGHLAAASLSPTPSPPPSSAPLSV